MIAKKTEAYSHLLAGRCISHEDAEKLPYLREQSDHSLYFQNAFTVTPYTNPVFKAMFYGIRQMDDLGYRQDTKDIRLDNSPIVKDMINNGYDFMTKCNHLFQRARGNS